MYFCKKIVNTKIPLDFLQIMVYNMFSTQVDRVLNSKMII